VWETHRFFWRIVQAETTLLESLPLSSRGNRLTQNQSLAVTTQSALTLNPSPKEGEGL